MRDRLLNFLNRVNFFSEQQFGFTKGKSTETALNFLWIEFQMTLIIN